MEPKDYQPQSQLNFLLNRRIHAVWRWCFPVLFFPTFHLLALLLVCFTILLKSRTLSSLGEPFIREHGCGWWMFQSISLLLGTSGKAQGDCSLWKAVTHNLNDYSSRHEEDSWLCAVSCWGLLIEKSEDHWLKTFINWEWYENIRLWLYIVS